MIEENKNLECNFKSAIWISITFLYSFTLTIKRNLTTPLKSKYMKSFRQTSSNTVGLKNMEKHIFLFPKLGIKDLKWNKKVYSMYLHKPPLYMLREIIITINWVRCIISLLRYTLHFELYVTCCILYCEMRYMLHFILRVALHVTVYIATCVTCCNLYCELRYMLHFILRFALHGAFCGTLRLSKHLFLKTFYYIS